MLMSNVEAWQFLVAFFSPYLIALINRPSWSSQVKRWVMVGVAVAVALVTASLNGQFSPFNWQSLLSYLVMMVGATQISYNALKSLSPTKASLDKVENAASGVTPAEAVQQKAEVKGQEIQDFEANIG